MTWRELWKSTVTNLRTLLGLSPPASARSSTPQTKPSPSAPAQIVKRKPMPLTGPVTRHDRADTIEYAPNTYIARDNTRDNTRDNIREHTSQMIDLTATRALPPPAAPLRTRKTPRVPLDVALDEAAFAARHPKAAELPPVVAKSLASTDLSWSKQGLAQLEPPMLDAPVADDPQGDAPPSAAHDPMHDPNGDLNAKPDYGDSGDDKSEGDKSEDGNREDGNREDGNSEDDEGVALTTLLESLLFVAAEPVEPRQLAQSLGQTIEVIELGLAELADYYQRSLRGLRVQRFNNRVQLVTAPLAAPFIETFLNLDNTTRLSSPALETLAVIAYRQPVTRAQIEAVRGVDCAGVLRSLVQRGLVADVGRMEGVGRPILYGVTELFMQHFGLMEMGELPPLEDTEADRLWAATVIDENDLDGSGPNQAE